MYVIDSDVLIDAKRRYYGFDICPGFWEWLAQECAKGNVASIEAVREEIVEGGEDDLLGWVHANTDFFLPEDGSAVASLGEVSKFVEEGGYKEFAKRRFLGGADPRLIGYAHAHECTLVTNEVTAPQAVNRIKIPDVCSNFDVSSVDPFVMLRVLGGRFGRV